MSTKKIVNSVKRNATSGRYLVAGSTRGTTAVGKPLDDQAFAGSIVDYARLASGDKKLAIALAKSAKIVTKSGNLANHYKNKKQ